MKQSQINMLESKIEESVLPVIMKAIPKIFHFLVKKDGLVYKILMALIPIFDELFAEKQADEAVKP